MVSLRLHERYATELRAEQSDFEARQISRDAASSWNTEDLRCAGEAKAVFVVHSLSCNLIWLLCSVINHLEVCYKRQPHP